MRLIDADALEGAKFHSIEDWTPVERASWQWGWNDAIDAIISSAPTVDPVKHGHWKEVQRIHETDHTAICECSLCGDTVWVYDGQRAWNYCPRCGAKMDEVET